MKKLIIIVIASMLLLGACAKQSAEPFEFRGHQFGDSMEEMIEREGKEPYDQATGKAGFDIGEYCGYECDMYGKFVNDKLYDFSLMTSTMTNSFNVEIMLDDLLLCLRQYGEPDKVFYDGSDIIAQWLKPNYAMRLIVSKGYFRIDIAERK